MYKPLYFALIFSLAAEVLSKSALPLPDGHCSRCPTELATNNAKVIQVAYFALGQLGPGRWLVKVTRAHSEERIESVPTATGRHKKAVVGVNYYLWLKLWENLYPRPGPKHCRVTVWEKLDGAMEMTMSSC